VSRELALAGVKCGNVTFPAVPRGEGILRLSVSSRHTPSDVAFAVEKLAAIARRHGLDGLSRRDLQSLGETFPLPEPLPGLSVPEEKAS
jgi:hypothetical protein